MYWRKYVIIKWLLRIWVVWRINYTEPIMKGPRISVSLPNFTIRGVFKPLYTTYFTKVRYSCLLNFVTTGLSGCFTKCASIYLCHYCITRSALEIILVPQCNSEMWLWFYKPNYLFILHSIRIEENFKLNDTWTQIFLILKFCVEI